MSLQHVKALNTTGFVDSSVYLQTTAGVSMGDSPVVQMIVKLYRDPVGVVTFDFSETYLTQTINSGGIVINFASPNFTQDFKSSLVQQDIPVGLDSATPRYYGGVLRVTNTNTWVVYKEDFTDFAPGTHRILDMNAQYRIN